eukprot:EG_transcript_736
MAPKAAPKKTAGRKTRDTAERPSGVFQEAPFPVWEEGDGEAEAFGDLSASRVDPSALFEADPGEEPQSATLGAWVASWSRPGPIFSPFKPMVVRPNVDYDPYGGTEEAVGAPSDKERQEKVAAYRQLKTLKGVAPRVGPNRVVLPQRPRRTQVNGEAMPNFGLPLASAILAVGVQQQQVEPDHYLWELIYPKAAVAGYRYPVFNPTGKYMVKLWYQGAWRKVLIDDRLPCDAAGDCLFPVTELKEIWPALLAKAMLRLLGPLHEARLFSDPLWCLMTLLGGWLPQAYTPTVDTATALKALRQAFMVERPPTQAYVNVRPMVPKQPKKGAGKGTEKPEKGDKGEKGDEKAPADLQEEEGERLVFVATPTTLVGGQPLQPLEEYHRMGLQPENCYVVYDAKPFQATTLLRLVSLHVGWNGTYSTKPDARAWAEDFRERFGPAAVERLSPNLTDFWVTWEEFTRYFGQLYALRFIASRRFACEQHLTVEEMVEETGHEYHPADPFAKFLYVKASTPCNALLTLTGLKVGPEDGAAPLVAVAADEAGEPPGDASQPPIEVLVYLYDWKSMPPVSFLSSFQCPAGHSNSLLVPIPKGETAYKIEVRNLARETLFAILSPRDLIWCDEVELCQNHLGLSVHTDAGQYLPHEPREWNLWFKRHIFIKSSTLMMSQFSILPPGLDVLALQAPPSADPKRKAAKASAKPLGDDRRRMPLFGGQRASLVPITEEEAQREAQELDLLSHIDLILIDCDSNAVLEGAANRIPITEIEPNKNGYMLIAHGRTPTPHPAGNFGLQIVSKPPMERVEARPFDVCLVKEGVYQLNPAGQLCKYALSSQEVVYLTVQVQVAALALPVTYSVLLQHNGETVLEKEDLTETCFIPNFWLMPPENKGGPSKYTVTVTLAPEVADAVLLAQRQQAVERFEQEKARSQEQQFQLPLLVIEEVPAVVPCASPKNGLRPGKDPRRQSQMSSAAKQSESKASAKGKDKDKDRAPPPPEKPPPRTWQPTLKENQVQYCLRVYASSARFTLDPDMSLGEELLALKAKWCHQDMAPAPKGKAAKGEPSAGDQLAARLARGREVRERFLNNIAGPAPTSPRGDQVVPKAPVVQRGLKEPVLLSEEAKAARLQGRGRPRPLTEDELAVHSVTRESEHQRLAEVLEESERGLAAVRELRVRLLREDRERREQFFAARHVEEAARARGSAEEEALQRLLEDAGKKASPATQKPSKKK